MPFVVDERGKENVVPVRLLSREKLGFLNTDCVIGNGQGNAGQQKQRMRSGLYECARLPNSRYRVFLRVCSKAITRGERCLV